MIRYAGIEDLEKIKEFDNHVSEEELRNIIGLNRVLLMSEDDRLVGLLRFNLFWDNTPFMNLLYIAEGERGKGYGKKLVEYWENEMSKKEYRFVLTSSRSDEDGQFFYRRLGYTDRGSLMLPGEALEIIFHKDIDA